MSILEQQFQHRAINVILFGVLASKFNAKSKIVNFLAGTRHDFFGQKTKGGGRPLRLKIFNEVPLLNCDPKKS